jgi:hypothetical protein
MKSKLLTLLLLAGGSLFAQPRFAVGVGVGGYPAPPPVVAYAPPPSPRPGYSLVGGYWYPSGPRYAWRGAYWARPPYAGARWIAPRYYGHRYYHGYWRR